MAVEGSNPVFPQSDNEQIVYFDMDSTKSITVCGRTERRSRSPNVDEVSGEHETLRKSGSWKDGTRPLLNSMNKSSGHLKKPPQHPAQRRGTSPLAWFPREKTASFLERKIKHLQESGGMNSTLDEFLGDSNPHYPKVEREKRAARSAANKAMEARKAAMVEASWCRILKAARINSKEAEEQLATAQMYAEEAFQEASAMGIVMYDRAGSPRRPFMIKTSPSGKGGSTHTVTASFETAFEVDKEVAAAVKQAIIHLHTRTHSSENNGTVVDEDMVQNINDQEIEGECDDESPMDSSENVSGDESDMLIDMMFQRLVLLNDNELESLSNIVATCGLNAILEVEESKQNRRAKVNLDYFGSLESCFPKHLSELEKEVNQAKNNKNIIMVGNSKSSSKTTSDQNEALPDLGSFLKKHKTRLEKEVEAAKLAAAQNLQVDSSNEHLDKENMDRTNQETGIGSGHSNSLESVLVKHVHRLEKEKSLLSLEKFSTRTCRRKVPFANQNGETESLDKVLVKHVSRLEREKMAHRATTEEIDRGFRNKKRDKEERNDSGLGDILVKHVPRLEREKMQQLQLPGNTTISSSSSSSSELRGRRSKEMEEAWGGVSLGNSSRPHLSRIQREKAAWSQAEEEERKRSLPRPESLEV